MAANDTPTLADRVQGLPAELFNDILDLVLAPDDPDPVVDLNYKPPVQLQIDRRSRAKLATAYYKKVTFNVIRNYDGIRQSVNHMIMPWLKSLSRQHRLSIEHIRLRQHLTGRDIYPWTQDAVLPLLNSLLHARIEINPRTISCNFMRRVKADRPWSVAWRIYDVMPFSGDYITDESVSVGEDRVKGVRLKEPVVH